MAGLSTPPTVAIYQFDLNEVGSPAPARHIPGGSFAYVKTLGSGAITDYLEFDNFTQQPGDYQISQTKVAVFRTADTGVVIDNMKVWTPDSSALDSGLSLIQFVTSGVWRAFPTITVSGQTGMSTLPTTLPGTQNLFRQDETVSLQSNDDANVSQYIYLSLALNNSYPNGRYGGVNGVGRFEIRVSYDYT